MMVDRLFFLSYYSCLLETLAQTANIATFVLVLLDNLYWCAVITDAAACKATVAAAADDVAAELNMPYFW